MKSKVIKICSDCRRVLSEDDFNWLNKKKGWKASQCKKCNKNRVKLWYENNKEQHKHSNKQWRKNNPKHYKQYLKQYYQDNKKHYKELMSSWQQDNRDRCNSYDAKYRALKKNQSPTLTPQENAKLLLYYKISEFMGEDWHVDHIKPISKGGLHHPDNLQVIPAHHNLCKNNNEDYIIPKELIIRI